MRTRAAPICAALAALASAPGYSAFAQAPDYPPAHRSGIVDRYHGVEIADPYRWLEELESTETLNFVEAQNRLSSQHLARPEHRSWIRLRLGELNASTGMVLPWTAAGRLFYRGPVEGKPRGALFMRAAVDGPPQIVLDLNEITPDGSILVRNYSVSTGGRYLGYTRSRGGQDAHQELAVRDLSTGRDLPDLIRGGWWMVWSHDERGFFYPRDMHGFDTATTGTALFYHVLGSPQEQDARVAEWPDSAGSWLTAHASDDGRYLTVMVNGTAGASNRLYVLDLLDPRSPEVRAPAVTRLDAHDAAYHVIGTANDLLYVVTNLDAPLWRVVRLDLSNAVPGSWETVVPEGAAPIKEAAIAGGQLIVNYIVDVKNELRRFTLGGEPLGTVPVPGLGSVWLNQPLTGRLPAPELFFEFVSFLTPRTNYRLDPGTGQAVALEPAAAPFDPARYEARQVFYSSKDGTRVPMFIVARKDLVLDGSSPAILTAYGGYGSSMLPYYRREWILWLEMGGVAALANIRGGGEYGETWHRDGSRERKQNSFDDFIAAAEYLIREGYTSASRLGIMGSSNGGLLVGAALTQRPDLFAAAVAEAGHHDMLRYHLSSAGRRWVAEYGSSDEPDEFRYLYAYSPLHNVRPGRCYPATLLGARTGDDRVVPSHSYKFAATLQASQTCERPILLRVGEGSHGFAPPAAALEELTDVWAFLAAQLGAAPPARSSLPL